MAIYRFTDTIERALRNGYPAEALNFNGIYFEDEIEGYQTLSVSGREALEAEVDYIETKARHGAKYRSSRYLPRVITVRYKIRAKDSSDLIEKYNRLNHLLGVEEARLTFQDEPDKFWIGTRRNLTPPEEGLLTTTGEIEFLCADPFKYSVVEYNAVAKDGAIVAFYNGTVPNPPRISIRAKSSINVLEFFMGTAHLGIGFSVGNSNESGPSTVLLDINGNAEQSSSVSYRWIADSSAVTLPPCIPQTVLISNNHSLRYEYDPVNDEYIDTEAGGISGAGFGFDIYTRLKGTWWAARKQLLGSYFIELSLSGYVIKHSVENIISKNDICGVSQYEMWGSGVQYDLVNQYGVKMKNFTLEWESEIYADGSLQRGAQVLTLYKQVVETEEPEQEGGEATEVIKNVPMFGVCVKRGIVGANRLEVVVYMETEVVDTIVMRADSSNPVFGINPLPCSISRFGNTCILKIGNSEYTYQTDDGASTPSNLTVYILDYNDSPPLKRNIISYIRFTEHTASSRKGITNRIKAGDEVILDCANADIAVNGITEPSLGDISNEWDAMDLLNGENGIGINVVCDGEEPEITMTYREAFI